MKPDRDRADLLVDPGEFDPEPQVDVRAVPRRVRQFALQIGAMDDEIRGPPTPARGREVQRRQLRIVAATQNAEAAGLGGERADRIENVELGEDSRRVGRELQPGAERLQRGRALEDRHVESGPRERERRRQPADSGANDQRASHEIRQRRATRIRPGWNARRATRHRRIASSNRSRLLRCRRPCR